MAKIIGGTTSTPNRVADWEQTNPNRADYIKNKPKVDQAYSNTSRNAQSGTAVAEAIYQLCPSFEETGETVICYPMGGTSLDVVAPEATTITRCGKNLWSTNDYDTIGTTADINITNGVYKRTFKVNSSTTNILTNAVIKSIYNGAQVFPAGVYSFSAESLITSDGGEIKPYLSVTLADGTTDTIYAGSAKEITKSFSVTAVLCANTQFNAGYVYTTTFQLERGNPTAYEPYRKEEFSADGGVIVPALDGYNTFFADVGTITVKGKENPIHAIDELRQAIISLGGNV